MMNIVAAAADDREQASGSDGSANREAFFKRLAKMSDGLAAKRAKVGLQRG